MDQRSHRRPLFLRTFWEHSMRLILTVKGLRYVPESEEPY